jgi:hypothetical protein
MRKYFTAIFFLYITAVSAQQQFGISMDRLNLPTINPGAIDFDFLFSGFNYKVTTSYRGSWSAIEGSPETIVVRAESVRARRHISLFYGVQAHRDEIGRFSNNNFTGKYAVIFSDDLDNKGLSIGLSAQLNQYRIDVNNITPENYNKLVGFVDQTQFLRPGIGIGIFYYGKRGRYDRFYTGLSSPLLVSIGSGREDAIYKNSLHLFYNAGYIKDLNDTYSYLEFSSLTQLETSGRILVTDFRTRYNFKNYFNAMIGYNTENFALFGFGVKQFMGNDQNVLVDFNYIGSFATGADVFRYFGVLHELNLSFSFGG